jgi:RNA polymerase sigma-70 factor (ECF subfamily)
MSNTDANLMRRANAGDPAAFAELVRRYQPALVRVACSRLGAAEAAEDLVQETFLAAYKSRHTYQERFGFRTWLWTILLNQCRRYAGRQARLPRAKSLDSKGLDDDAPNIADPSNRTEASAMPGLLAEERRELLESLLARISVVQADALRLRFFGGLKFQEIADAMQCSLCTAKNRVRWGLLRLAEFVEDQRTSPAAANDAPPAISANGPRSEAVHRTSATKYQQGQQP